MERRVAFIIVGLFSLCLIVGTAIFVLWTNQHNESGKATNRYAIFFNQAVNGLSLGSSVRYLGVDIGQVEGISLDSSTTPPQVKIEVGIEKLVPITMGDVATIKPSGITGVSFIDLRHDKDDATPLKTSSDTLPVIRSELSDLDKILNSSSASLDHFNTSLVRLEKIMDDKNLAHLANILDNLDRTSAAFAAHSNDFDRNASLAVRDSRQAVNNFSELSKSLHDNPSQILYPNSQRGIEIKP